MIVTCRNCGSKCEIVDNYCRHCGALLELGSITGTESPIHSVPNLPSIPNIPSTGESLPEPTETIEPHEDNTLVNVLMILTLIIIIRLLVG
ncbi:MAG: hypothetical protein LBC41_05150 [Clostridiales bacterium]|nr:hypothetical protein [Clostridiales bacterium]MDR2750028.1 hypothetical protein [Clostridiales bacterium]